MSDRESPVSLIDGIVREMRAPILGIASAAQLLRFRAREDPVIERNVGRILHEVERLNHVLSALDELSRLGPPTLAPGDPDAVWDEVIAGHQGDLESRSLALQRRRPAASHGHHAHHSHHAKHAVDAEQLARAFAQLLLNAAEAAPEASDIVLESETLPDGRWRCRLSNGGPPVAPDVLPRVFDPFVTTKPGGTGLGLPLARRIVQGHGGTIELSTGAEGTVVTVELP